MENESQWYDEVIKQMETNDLLGTKYDPNYYEEPEVDSEEEEKDKYSLEANDGNF
jgi:hypothetical protein